MLFTRIGSSNVLKNSLARSSAMLRGGARQTLKNHQQKRNMGGGRYLEISYWHTLGGEIAGCVMWLWIFHRFRHDGAVLLGLKHPWEHGHDPWDISGEAEDDDQYDFESKKPDDPFDEDDDDEDDEDEDEDEDDEE